ncbi:MAG: hypothetical protein ACH350_07360 [Parachlamydiaceae bacterium]
MDSKKKQTHAEFGLKYSSETFDEDFSAWSRGLICQKKSSIDPHS